MAGNSSGTVVSAGTVIFRRNGPNIEYLLLQSSRRMNLWTPPKGKVEKGESLREAAVRETLEEAGLSEADYDEPIPNFNTEISYQIRDGRTKRVAYWLAEITDGSKITLSHEHGSYDWFGLDKVIELTKFPSLHNALKQCEEEIKKTKT